jgi:hypothetical protein
VGLRGYSNSYFGASFEVAESLECFAALLSVVRAVQLAGLDLKRRAGLVLLAPSIT